MDFITQKEREIVITNNTDLTFFVDPRPYEGSYFISNNDLLKKDQPLIFKLRNENTNANGVISFTLNDSFAFSLFIRDNLIKIYGCKSQPVFFHPEYYFCTMVLDDPENGKIEMHIKQSFHTP